MIFHNDDAVGRHVVPFLVLTTSAMKTPMAVMAISTTESAAIAGSILSLMPFQIWRGSVLTPKLVMNSVTAISSHDRIKARNAAVVMPNFVFGMITQNIVCHNDAPIPCDARSNLRSSLDRATMKL